jgi:signal transduction histidine kinase/ActR/RegA family two-component response regulator
MTGAPTEIEARLRAALDAMADPCAVLGAIRDEGGRIVDFRIEHVNGSMAALNRMPVTRQVGHTLLQLFPASRESGLFDRHVQVVETGEPMTSPALACEGPDAAGGPIELEHDLVIVKAGDGCIVSGRDSTDRVLTEQVLRESERERESLIQGFFESEGASRGIVDVVGGRILDIAHNASAAAIFNLDDQPGSDPGPSEIALPADVGPLWIAHCEESRATGSSARFEYAHDTGERIRWLLVTVTYVGMMTDGASRYTYVAIETTDRVRAEEELRRATTLLEASQSQARVGGWEVDVVRGTLYWTDETYRIHDTTPDEYTPSVETAIAFYAPECVPIISAAVQDGIENGTPFDLELELITAASRRIWVRATSVVTVEHGRTVKITGAFQDITTQKRLEAQLLQAQRLEAVGQLAGGIAHDFNNLLTAIRGFAELARRNIGTDASSGEDLDQVLLAADRAAELTRQLLAFGRRQVLRPRVLDPAEIVEGVVPLLRRLLGEHIELSTHIATGLGRVRIDPSQFEQVIVNLVVNSRDAMTDGGNLTIEVADLELDTDYVATHAEVSAGPHVRISVSDTGHGMDEATLTHIFEPFFTTKEPGDGTGMGLATVYGIVKQSGGSINVYSEPGYGTTFKIYLPRVDEEATPLVQGEPAGAMPTGTETILLVEDEDSVRAFAVRVLSEQGYLVLDAANGAEALALAAAHGEPIDLLVTDVIMPGLQGHQLAVRMLAIRPGLRVLYVSGFTENSVVHHGVPDHGVVFLPKPFTGEALCTAVRQALDVEQ